MKLCKRYKATLLIAVLSLPMLLSACVQSGSPVAIAPNLPPLPANLKAECRDPGIKGINTVGEAVTVLGENRVYAACNLRKHRDTKSFYESVRRKLNPS